MAYPTQTLNRVVEDIDRLAANVKQYATRRKADMAGGNVGSTTIFDIAINIRDSRNRLATMSAVVGIAERAATLKGLTQTEVATAFNGMLSAMDAIVAWVAASFPKDANGFLLSQTLGADGPIDRQFTPEQTAGLQMQLDAIIESID